MQAEWNVIEISKMNDEQTLRNTCRQLEQQYVDWRRPATYKGSRVSMEFPYIGECGRYTSEGLICRFVTTYRRSIEVQAPDGKVLGEFKMQPGLAKQLYVCAGQLLDTADHCEPNGDPCRCEICFACQRSLGDCECYLAGMKPVSVTL
jgi:hypothetical protein